MSETNDDRQARLARNEHVFRTVNENIAAGVDTHHVAADHPYEFVCECASNSCAKMITLTRGDYERVRAHSDHFVLVPGHEQQDIEVVVERNDKYYVVEKIDVGKRVARDLADQPGTPAQ